MNLLTAAFIVEALAWGVAGFCLLATAVALSSRRPILSIRFMEDSEIQIGPVHDLAA